MEKKRFQMKDEAFVCAVCGHRVEPNGVTARDHCPKCLSSLHVDVMPGDRANPCRGILEAISARPHPKKGFQIIYRCRKCGKIHHNKAALGGTEPDDMDLIIGLTAKQVEE